jgi:hypothetical protein
MKIYEGLNLDPAQVRRRERALANIERMRTDLAELEMFIARADAETLRGDLWEHVVQEAGNEVSRALRFTTHEGQARKGWRDG